ncbi:MAG: ABC transporter ATP-binding protein [Clostridia bacterium]
MELLEMKHITKAFPGVIANDDVNLAVRTGEIHALLGENGAGKTTLMNILYGLYRADSGDIFWEGKRVEFVSPMDALCTGIGMVHQHFALVPTMTVLQNMILGLRAEGYPFVDTAKIAEQISALAERYGLVADPQKKISALSVGEQQRVEILKALYRKTKLLILDEPTAVLTPKETEDFFHVLRRLRAEGHAVILITHRMSEIMEISDRVTILRNGKNVETLLTADTDTKSLSELMIGREMPPRSLRSQRKEIDTPLLELREAVVQHNQIPRLNVSLAVYPGEILGIAGVDGNGQKELAEAICGVCGMSRGELYLEGREISRKNVRKRFEAGIAYISDDRQHDGLVMDMDVSRNLILRCYAKPPFTRRGTLQRKTIADWGRRCVEKYQIKTPSLQTQVRLLSGGNQQKAILARELGADAKLIVACQPTRGLDVGATAQVRSILMEQRNAGKSVLLISADLDEILELSDRIAVLFRGRIMGVLPNDAALTVQRLGSMMGGQETAESEEAHA